GLNHWVSLPWLRLPSISTCPRTSLLPPITASATATGLKSLGPYPSAVAVTAAAARTRLTWSSATGCKSSATWTSAASPASGLISRPSTAARGVTVLRLLIGSNEEEVAGRLGISAETVGRIVRNQLADAKAKEVDPQRVITDVGIDELSLKKRHKLYATLLTDLTDPERPEVLAVADGRDEAAARKCLGKLAQPPRERGPACRADMAPAFHGACRELLPSARPVVDRFHVAKAFNEAVDGQRKKNHAGVQGGAVAGGAEGVSGADVGVPPGPRGAVG